MVKNKKKQKWNIDKESLKRIPRTKQTSKLEGDIKMSIKIYSEEEKNELKKLSKNAMSISVAEIADNLYGLTLYIGENGYLKCKEHPSLEFDLRRNLVFENAKMAYGMGPYDFMAFYEDIGFLQARNKLNQYYQERDPRFLNLYRYNNITNEVFVHRGLYHPDASVSSDVVHQFLESKNVPDWLGDWLIKESFIYQDKQDNIVFIGFDERNKPAFGMTLNDSGLTECDDSCTKVGFSIVQESAKELVICDDILKGIEVLAITPNVNILCSKDADNLNATVMYALKNTDILTNASNITFVVDDLDLGQKVIDQLPFDKERISAITQDEYSLIYETQPTQALPQNVLE